MSAFFADGRAFDLVLACLAAEAMALIALRAATGRGLPVGDVLTLLGAGVGLAMAARAALLGLFWIWVAAGLCLALAAHALDLRSRWLSGRRAHSGFAPGERQGSLALGPSRGSKLRRS